MDTRPQDRNDRFEDGEGEAEAARDPFAPDPELLKIPEALREPPAARKSPEAAADVTGREMAGLGKAWGTALDFVFTILAGTLIGYFVGKWAGNSTVGLLIGMGMGFVSAFIRIVRQVQREERLQAARRHGASRR